VIQCLTPGAVTSLGSPARLFQAWHQGVLSAWTSELQQLRRDGSNPVASFLSICNLHWRPRVGAKAESRDSVNIARLAPHAAPAPLHAGFSFYNPIGRGALAPWRPARRRLKNASSCGYLILRVGNRTDENLDSALLQSVTVLPPSTAFQPVYEKPARLPPPGGFSLEGALPHREQG